MTDDSELMIRLARSDRSALGEIFDRHRSAVYARAFVTVGSRPDAEELTQDTFFLLWRKRKRIRLHGESLLPWLLVTVKYLGLNARRYHDRRKADPFDDETSRSRGEFDPETAAAKRELEKVLHQALDKLHPLDRAIVHLCLIEGLSYKQAATRLGVSHAVVRNRLSRARQSLRGEVGAYEEAK